MIQEPLDGWFVTIEGQFHVLSGEDLFLLFATAEAVEEQDAETLVITLAPRVGDPLTITQSTRLIFPKAWYAAIVYPVSYTPDEQPHYQWYAQVTKLCFGAVKVPRNAQEADFLATNFWWRALPSEEEQNEYFLPGEPLDWCTRAAMDNYEEFCRLKERYAR